VADKTKQYRVTGQGLDYPSIKDGKRRIRVTGDLVDDLPPTDIPWLLEQGAIADPESEDAEPGDDADTEPEAGDA
jgi:hypothetical protein